MKTLYDGNINFRASAVFVLLSAIISSVTLFAQDKTKQEIASDSPANFLDINQKLDAKLDKQVYSGGEPTEREHFRWLAGKGIKTIVSVDGVEPNVELAKAFGMQYVHVPLSYAGIPRESGLALIRVFREISGPLYVHCHHGRHRAPAAVGYMLRGNRSVSEGEALEILLHGGTSKEYRGLWSDVQEAKKLDEKEALPELKSKSFVPDFTKGMATLSRNFEKLQKAAEGDLRQRRYLSLLLIDDFRELERKPFAKEHGGGFRALLGFSTKLSSELYEASKKADVHPEKFNKLLDEVKQNCTRCHEQFR